MLMKKISFLLAFLLALVGGTTAWAGTLTENFDDLQRLDANGNVLTSNWSYGYSLSNGWLVSPSANAISASKTMHYGIAAGGYEGNALWSGYGSSNSYYMVIPTVLTGEIKFKAYKNTTTKTPYVKFFEVTEEGGVYTVTSTQLGETVTPASASWEDYSVNIGDEGKLVAINMVFCGIDNFEAETFEETGAIAKPTAFTVGDMTFNSAVLSWTAGGEETAWQLVYDTDANFDKDAATPLDVTENPYTLTGLADGTTYYAYLRAKKGDEVSAWTSKLSFTTPEQFPRPTDFSHTDHTATTATFTWTAGSTETAWQISYATAEGFDPDTEGTIVDVTTNPATLEGLTAETSYYACIRANYGGSYSAWTDKVSFKPTAMTELTLNDDTRTNMNVPINGSYVDSEGTMSQFIIPATSLTSIDGRQITQMTFYGNNDRAWNAKYKVYLQEVTETTFSDNVCDWTGMEEVAEATVNVVDGKMVIELDTPYEYGGSNLMVGFKLSATGTYNSISWYGTSTGANTARYGYNGWSGVTNEFASFLPKVTIGSIPGSGIPRPKMVVTQPESLDFGIIAEPATKTFTIANTGKAKLEGITVVSSNAAFTVTGAPATLEVGATAEVTVTMATDTKGSLTTDITVKGTDVKDVKFTLKGFVLPEGMPVVDFNDNQLPARWENTGWTFSGGAAYAGYSSMSNRFKMTTPKVVVTEGDYIVVKAKLDNSSSIYYVTVRGSSDNGETWTAYTKRLGNDILGTDYTAVVLDDVPATVNKLQFEGYYVTIDEIWGINYGAELAVTLGEETVTSPATYDFGTCPTDATVTYHFDNASGVGSVEVINVEITGDGAAAYSTNWTAGVAVPFDLVITRTYDANRTEPTDAVVTVTTTVGTFVINVTGKDRVANQPELAVSATTLDFGKVTADAVETITVTNAGTGVMAVNIVSDNEVFVVSDATLEEIGAGESKEFTVTFKYSTDYGKKTANITVTPTYDAEAAVIIAATAKAMDPNVWSESFDENTLPTGWDAGANWTVTDHLAKASWSMSSTNYLTTPTLAVSGADDELTFDYKATANYVSIKIQMSKDGAAFADYKTISADRMDAPLTYTISGLEAGTYQFRFANDDYELDNFEGFKLSLADHIVTIAGSSIPESSAWSTTMKEGRSFEATVTVKESRGVDENFTAKVYMGEDVIGETADVVEANSTKTVTIVCVPNATSSTGIDMHIEVEYAGGTLSTDPVTRYVNAQTYLTLDQTSTEAITAGTYDNVTLNRPFIAGFSTVCLPFAISDVEAFFGVGAKAYTFDSYSEGVLNFNSVTTMDASYPYVIWLPEAITEPVILTDVTIASVDTEAFYTRVDGSYFRGTYVPTEAGALENMYLMNSKGEVNMAAATATIKGFRAYLELQGDAPTLVTFDGADVATGIEGIKMQNVMEGAYNMQGQKVVKAAKGLYIINGKKVVVK